MRIILVKLTPKSQKLVDYSAFFCQNMRGKSCEKIRGKSMKSVVDYYVDLADIEVPEHYLTLHIPSWEAVIQPTLMQMQAHFNPNQEQAFELTDEHVQQLGLQKIQTVVELKEWAKSVFSRNYKQTAFYKDLLPYLVLYYVETAQVVLNSEEVSDFIQAYCERLRHQAEEEGVDFEQYVAQLYQLGGNVMEQLQERLTEEFIFKLIAHADFYKRGGALDEDAYEAFVVQNVIHQGADEIEVRERFPFDEFQRVIPEMMLVDKLYEYFETKMMIVTSDTSEEV